MKTFYDRRLGEPVEDRQFGGGSLRFLYERPLGRLFLRLVIRPFFSRMVAYYYRSPLSRRKIKAFIQQYGVDLKIFEGEDYRSFNDFFIRKKKPEFLPDFSVDKDQADSFFYSPADSKLMLYDISDGLDFSAQGRSARSIKGSGKGTGRVSPVSFLDQEPGLATDCVEDSEGKTERREGTVRIKGHDYRLEDLVGDREEAARFAGGTCLVFRLSVDDYHRYMHVGTGPVIKRKRIDGKLHTVSDFSKQFPIFIENQRCYEVVESDGLGRYLQMEVGALLVGKIVNREEDRAVLGREKGYFEFGGSTIIVLLEKGRMFLDEGLTDHIREGMECRVKYGERIGRLCSID